MMGQNEMGSTDGIHLGPFRDCRPFPQPRSKMPRLFGVVALIAHPSLTVERRQFADNEELLLVALGISGCWIGPMANL